MFLVRSVVDVTSTTNMHHKTNEDKRIQTNTNVTYAVSAVANCNCSASRNKRGGAKLRSMYACLYSSISQLNTVLMDKSTLCKCLAITSKQRLVVILLVLVFKTSHKHTKNTCSYTCNIQSDPGLYVQNVVGTGKFTPRVPPT